MELENLSKYTSAEKIILAEQLWDSVSKNEITISKEVENELDRRIQVLEEGKTQLYTLEEVKARLDKLR